jgi:hemerythrin-like domain-containing protein
MRCARCERLAVILRFLRMPVSAIARSTEALEALETDLHQHIHLENNILFPRAVATEKTH